MACRNLTKQFLEVRNASKANRSLRVRQDSTEEPDFGLLNPALHDSGNWKSAKECLPPVWVDKIDDVETDIKNIEKKIKELSTLHTKRLMVNFESDEVQQEHEIDMKTQEITELFRHAEGLLKRFSKQGDENNISVSERAVRNNMQRSIAKKLQGLNTSLRSTQKEYLSNLQKSKDQTGSQVFDYLDKKEGNAKDQGFNSTQLQILEDTEELVNERDEEIAHIAKSIEELAQIFKELAVLVIDQGTILDRIDFNMETAVEHAKEGIVQLQKAEEHQKNALPCRCIIVLIILIAIMLGVLIWKHSPSRNNK